MNLLYYDKSHYFFYSKHSHILLQSVIVYQDKRIYKKSSKRTTLPSISILVLKMVTENMYILTKTKAIAVVNDRWDLSFTTAIILDV